MASNDYIIKIVLQAVDQVTRPLAGIARSLTSLKGLTAGIGAYFAFSAMKRNILEAEAATHRLEMAVKNMGAGAGRTVKQIDALATEIQRTTRFSDDAAKEAAVKLLRYNKLTGESFDRALIATTNLAEAMQIDLGGAARMVGMALQDPQRGMLMLRRAGIILSAQQRELIKDLMKTGQVAKAQDVIFGELEKVYGGFARAARNTLGGALEGLENQFTDLFEGDSSSFGNAVKAINDLAAMLDDPRIKEGFDTLIAGAVNAAAAFIQWTTAMLGGMKALADLRAAQEAGYTMATNTPLDAAVEELKRLKREREAQVNAVAAISGQQASIPAGAQIAPILGNGENLKRVVELNKAIDEQIRLITKLQTVTGAGKSGAATGGTATGGGGGGDPMAGLQEVLITARKIGEGAALQIAQIEREVLLSAMPEQKRLAEEWAAEEAEAVAAGISAGLDKAQIDQRVKEIADKYLEPIEITAVKLPIPQMEKQVNEFAVQAARNIQDAFANAFMNIGHGMDSFFDGLKNSFKALLANLAAKKLAEAMGLTELLAGKPATGGLGKVLQDIFDIFSTKKSTTTTSGKAGGGLEEVVITATRMDPVPVTIVDTGVDSRNPATVLGGTTDKSGAVPVFVVNWPESMKDQCRCVSSAIGEAIGSGDSATADAVNEGTETLMGKVMRTMRTIFGNLRAMFDKVLGGLGRMMDGVLAGISRIAKKAGKGDDGGMDWGQIVQVAWQAYSAYAGGGAAGGGRIGGPTLVGEEGPELFFPGMSGTVFNNRQLAFAGGGRGPAVNYSPTYNIVMSGAKDDKEAMRGMQQYIERKDAETEARIYERLRRNGYGRMRR